MKPKDRLMSTGRIASFEIASQIAPRKMSTFSPDGAGGGRAADHRNGPAAGRTNPEAVAELPKIEASMLPQSQLAG